jgi:hypothetical protein
MKSCRLLLVLGVAALLTWPAPAGFLFFGKTKPNPNERVPQLLSILRTDPDENKRVGAAKELREFDPKVFPGIIHILVDVLKHDQKAAVRVEVVQTLAKLRPISPEAGMALESAEEDPSWRVRWQARQSLLSYRLSGYRSPPKPEATSQAAPPASKPTTNSAPAAKRGLFGGTSKGSPSLVPNETPPPPLADPAVPAPKPGFGAKGPSAPAPQPQVQPPPSEAGPDLPFAK